MKNSYFKNCTFSFVFAFACISISAQSFTNYYPVDGIIEGGIYTIEEDQHNNLWFGSWTNPAGTPGLAKFDGTTFNQYSTDDGLVGNHVTVVFEDSAYNLWIGTRTGVSKFDGSVITNYTVDNGLVFNEVWDILEDNNGNIWFSTHQGVSMFDGITWTNYTLEDHPALVYVNDIMMDANGHIWFGSAGGGGISKFDGVTWTNYTTENSGLVANDVFEVYQDTDNNYWFATYSGNGLSKFDGTTWTTYTTADGLSNNKVRVITQDSFGDLWFGTNTGLSRYNGSSWKTYTTADDLIAGGVRSIHQDKDDNLWVGTWSSGLSNIEISKVNIPDPNFEQSLIDLEIDTNGLTGDILRVDAENAPEINANFPVIPDPADTDPSDGIDVIVNPFADPRVSITTKIADLTGIEAFTNLTLLGVAYNELSTVDLSYNTKLDDLFLSDNLLTSIDISKNTMLTRFGVMRNPNIGTVDVNKNVLLKELFLENTGISSIDLTNNLDLWKIRLENNNLTDLNLSNNINLEELRCQNNNLTGVNASFNTKLIDINVRYNAPLTYLNLKNGNNKYVTRFDIRDTALTCITADGDYVSISESDSGVSQLMFNYSGGLLSEDCGTVYIPDPNFEQALIDLGVDQSDILDGVILRSEAESVGWLPINDPLNNVNLPNVNAKIQDLTGIDAFINLTGIECTYNNIANLDFSSNPKLVDVYASYNSMRTINVSSNPELKQLFLFNNDLTSLDVGNNPLLETFICQYNDITSLDLSANPNLKVAFCSGNQLTSLNIANGNNANFTPPSWTDKSFLADSNPNLTCIQVDADILYSIPAHWVKDDIAVYDDDCSSFTSDWGIVGSATPNGWGGPDIVLEATNVANVFEVITDLTDGLIKFRRNNNWAENYGDFEADGTLEAPPYALDIPVTAGTYKIVMDLNNLTYSISPYIPILGVVGSATPGGWNNNNGIPDIVLTFNEDLNTWTGNANLTNGEIKFRYENDWSVNFGDDGLDNTLDPNGANIPVAEGFYFVRIDLNAMTYSLEDPYVSIPDSNFEQALIDLGLDGNIGDPIDGFILRSEAEAITDLNINSKGIINLTGIEAFTNLSVLYCQNNQLQELDVTQNTALTVLECEGNGLEELNVTKNPLLRVLGFGPNNLTEIDVSQNLLLEAIWTNGNKLSSINLDANTKLVVYGLSNNPYKYVSLKNGNNVNVGYFEANNTPSLDCINADSEISGVMIGSGKTFSEDCSNSIAGRWIIAPEAGALKVGPEPFSDQWWALNKYQDDIAIRACYLDDVYEFGVDGSFKNILGSSTWLEPFQGVATEQCGAPVAPHDGSVNATYDYNQLAGTIALDGKGAYLGLPKVVNGGILSDPNAAPESIVYDVSFSENGNVMTLSINFGPGFFTYKFLKESVFIPDPNFEQALIDLGIDSDGEINKRMLRSDAEAVTELNVNVESLASSHPYGEGTGNSLITNVTIPIEDLTGIEAFVNLTRLSCGYHLLSEVDVSMLTNLERLELANNQLSSIDLSNLTNLVWLNVIQNQISEVDLMHNLLLEIIWVESNLLNNIDISLNSSAKNLAVGYNALTSLNVSNNPNLWAITAEGNNLETIDISNNLGLVHFWVFDNPNFNKVDVSKQPLLTSMGIWNTSITTLDLSNNPSFNRLYAADNPLLKHLDIRNGNNSNITTFDVANTPNLTCVNADAVISQIMTDSGKTFSEDCGDFVYIPDENFEQSLIDLGFDSDGVVNTSILREDAELVTDLNLTNPLFDSSGFENPLIVNVTGKIADLTGLEAFVYVDNFQLSNSDITSIDVSNLVALEELFVSRNLLTAIDITQNSQLKRFGVMYNNIAGTVDISQNTLLEELFLHETGITSVDLATNSNLWKLYIYNNNLSQLNISTNTNLTEVRCQNNSLTTLDISTNTAINRVDVQYNSNLVLTTDATLGSPTLTSLNLSGTGLSNYNGASYPNIKWLLLNDNSLTRFNGNNALLVENLFLNNNNIDKLVLSSNTLLKQLHANNNNVLTQIDVRNGNNIDLATLNATGNLLTCISVDEPTNGALPYASWNIDSGVILSDNCGAEPEVILIPDANFEAAIGAILDTNGINGNILVSDAEAITSLIVSGSSIIDLTGIEGFVNLTDLNVSNNLLSSINLLENTNLINVDVSQNLLTELFINSGRKLAILNCSDNQLTTLNFADLTDLIIFDASINQFTSFDASSHDLLTSFNVSSNLLTELDMRNGNNSAITLFDARSNLLGCIGVDDSVESNSNNDITWFKDGNTVYTNNGDCQAPTVLTQNFDAILDSNGLVSIEASDVDDGSFDNVTIARNLVYSLDITDFDCSSLGDQTVNLTVTDEVGNSASGTAIVSVIDNSSPSANAIRGTYMHDLADGNSFDPTLLDDGSTDNCGIASFSLSQSYFTLSGTYYLDLIVEDSSGNVSTDQVEVEITDSENSEILTVGNVTVTVYPNPFQDYISLKFSKNMDFSTVSVSLTDFNGNLTGAAFAVQDASNLKATGLSGLAPGSYILTVSKGRKSDTAIMIKN